MSTSSPRPAVFLDRDGVLIKAPIVKGTPAAIRSVAELELTRDAASFCAALRERDVPLFVFTNQPDVVRGLTSRYVVEQINTAVSSSLGITETAVCWTDDDEDPRRKPNPGMILELAEAHGIDVAASVTIGDRWRDIAAGERAGSATVFIDRHYDERGPDAPDLTVTELGKALDWVLERLGV
ncbi:MAG: HAD-IIIA family hydrolase [Solirubrobacteraceae bacterium]|nr:HAD-IIIA family hydrolase [Solirubrobacteraceae bacterium]